MRPCTSIEHTLWIGNNFPGVFSLPNLVNVSDVYIGDAFYDDQSQTITSGTLTGVSFPALQNVGLIRAVNQGSINSIDVPNLTGNNDVTLSGLPALANFSLNAGGDFSYINITNTGIVEFSYGGPGLSTLKLIGNPSLAKVTVPENSYIQRLEVDCGGLVTSRNSLGYKSTQHKAKYPMPRFTGPKNVSSFEISFCKQPSGDWKTALTGLGSTASFMVNFHHNEFLTLSVPDLRNTTSTISIEDNRNLTEIVFPALKAAGSLMITDNPSLYDINALLSRS